MQAAPERVQVIPSSPKYERLNPQLNLRHFTVSSPELCVLTLRLEEGITDPVELAFPRRYFKIWAMRDTALPRQNRTFARGGLLRRQFCLDHPRKHFRINHVLQGKGPKDVWAKSLGHLIAHLSMIHAHSASESTLPFRLEETTFYNLHNSREVVIVYNWPLREDYVGAYVGVAMDYVDSCVAGNPDMDFLIHLEEQRDLHLKRREWELDHYRAAPKI